MLLGQINQSYIDTFDTYFYAVLRERGSQMLNGVMPTELSGRSVTKRQYETGRAQFINEKGEDLQEISTTYSKRVMSPHEIRYAFSVTEIDQIMQVMPDVSEIASAAANECGLKLDELIINGVNGSGGIIGSAKTYNENELATVTNIPYTQYVPYNNRDFGTVKTGGSGDDVPNIDNGLTVSKLAKAVSMLDDANNHPPYILVSTSKAQATLRADPRASNFLFNQQRPLESGLLQYPVMGISGFIQSAQVPRNIRFTYGDVNGNPAENPTALVANSSSIEYAIVYALDQIQLGIARPFTLRTGQDVRKAFNDVFMYNGFYDCLRMQEKSVVIIECGDKSISRQQN